VIERFGRSRRCCCCAAGAGFGFWVGTGQRCPSSSILEPAYRHLQLVVGRRPIGPDCRSGSSTGDVARGDGSSSYRFHYVRSVVWFTFYAAADRVLCLSAIMLVCTVSLAGGRSTIKCHNTTTATEAQKLLATAAGMFLLGTHSMLLVHQTL